MRLLLIPGKGKTLLVQTSAMAISSLIRSCRRGARVGMCADDICDCERITEKGVVELFAYFGASVFLMITCCKFEFGPKVAAR